MAGLLRPSQLGCQSINTLILLDKIVIQEAGPLLATPKPKMFPRGRRWSVFRQI
ncbi:hypothetical protein GGD63_003532 [Bradyrhizobium sp. cir1]|nr:hypothetical protein [Bradyrhizobium sp. cir1]